MLKKLIRQMLAAQISSALAVSLCLLIDSLIIGRCLEDGAMAAFMWANPLLLSIGAIGTLLSAGVQIVCGRSLGTGSASETNAGYSTAVALAGGISLAFTATVLLLSPALARIMGAGSRGALFDMTKGYLEGFSIGAPGSMGALVLVPFLQMAGQSGLLVVAVLSMTVADVALDLLNVYVFHGGMFGMGLASSVSYYIAIAVTGVYFLSRRCVFRFSFRQVSLKKAAELFREGIPAGFNMAASVIMVFLMNRILRTAGGSAAVGAFGFITSIGNTVNCITTGVGGVSLTLAGIFFHEEDRTALRSLIRQLCRYGAVLGLGAGVLLVLFAPALASLFVHDAGQTRQMTTLGLRLFAGGLIPCCINNALKYGYQATRRIGLTELISMLEGAVFPVIAAWVFSRIMGVSGAWLYFTAGEWLTLLLIAVFTRILTGKKPWEGDAALLLKNDFGVTEDRLLEMEIRSMREVADAAEKAQRFCREHGQGEKISAHVALCIEEMAGNTIQHGFSKDQKPHELSVRLLEKDDCLVLRFRDDCGSFDPVHYIPAEDEKALGIRLMLAFAKEANYTYALNLNNLCIRIGSERPEQRPAAPANNERTDTEHRSKE